MGLAQVTVCTGKKGYYKYKEAIDKTTKLDVVIHDSHESVGAPADLGNKVFAHANKTIASTRPQQIDGLELPFFRLGGHLGVGRAFQGSSSSAAPLAAPSALPMASICPPQAEAEDDGSDSDQENVPPTVPNAMDAIHQAIPNRAKDVRSAGRAGLTTPKPAAKAKVVPTRSKGSTKNRKGAEGGSVEGEDSSKPAEPKIMRLQDRAASKANGMATGMTDSDSNIVRDFVDELKPLKQSILAVSKDTEAGLQDHLKSIHKNLIVFVNKIKSKKKSLKRRKDATELNEKLTEIQSEVTTATSLISSLSSFTCDQKSLVTIKEMQNMETAWNIGPSVLKRCIKSTALQCLKFTDWPAFTELRAKLHDEIGVANGEQFFEMLVSELTQRLLRALAGKADRSCSFDIYINIEYILYLYFCIKFQYIYYLFI